MTNDTLTQLSDRELLDATTRVAQQERRVTTELIALLAELDARKLYLGQGCSSLFTYCTHVLHLSEAAAYGRITAARMARRFPRLLGMIEKGDLTLTSVGLLAPHLTDENQESLLEAARHLSKRDVERLIAALYPQPDIPPSIRALPVQPPAALLDAPLAHPTHSSLSSATPAGLLVRNAPPHHSIVAPLAPRRYLLRITIGEETQRKLERARALLRHQVPDGDPAAIIDRALTLLVTEVERTKFAATKGGGRNRQAATTAPGSRRIPSAIRRAVWLRDAGRCAFIAPAGRCAETAFIEFHHVMPFATGGTNTVENLELRCRAHNQYEAERAGLGRWRTDAVGTARATPCPALPARLSAPRSNRG